MELVVLTGLSGAGKSDALKALEDLDYYCIDNMPPALITEFVNVAKGSGREHKLALCVDVRSLEFLRDMGRLDSEGITSEMEDETTETGAEEIRSALLSLRESGVDLTVIFLEAGSDVLVRRYSQTRRQHPLDQGSGEGTGLIRSIELERQMMAGVRLEADYVIDTSGMKPQALQAQIIACVTDEESKPRFVVNVKSFGFKYGIPIDADMVVDMRFVPNPYYVPSLKEHTGNSARVQEYVFKHEITRDFLDGYLALLGRIIPGYIREGKFHLNLACGCTGGHHRSVAMANRIAEELKNRGYQVTLVHRDL